MITISKDHNCSLKQNPIYQDKLLITSSNSNSNQEAVDNKGNSKVSTHLLCGKAKKATINKG